MTHQPSRNNYVLPADENERTIPNVMIVAVVVVKYPSTHPTSGSTPIWMVVWARVAVFITFYKRLNLNHIDIFETIPFPHFLSPRAQIVQLEMSLASLRCLSWQTK